MLAQRKLAQDEVRGQGSEPLQGGREAGPDHGGSRSPREEDGFHLRIHGSPRVHCVGRERRHIRFIGQCGAPTSCRISTTGHLGSSPTWKKKGPQEMGGQLKQ